jgi:N-formylglutamate deformylase
MIGTDWLTIARADSPLILAMPHDGTLLPDDLTPSFRSPWWARRDTDWHIAELYADLAEATVVKTAISRSVIDVNRDPSGASLYPGQAMTALCPTTSFDGDPLYHPGAEPNEQEIQNRRSAWFDPYHRALAGEIARLRARHPHIVVYDCHSIRSHIPRLFDAALPELNIGTNGGVTCAPDLREAVTAIAAGSGRSHVVDGRFRGGWTTRHYGQPDQGVHAIQMEIAMRAYLPEPDGPIEPETWPPLYDRDFAAPLRSTLADILTAIAEFTKGHA